jgi:polyhydroxyalkanoate synthesis regulator phasin
LPNLISGQQDHCGTRGDYLVEEKTARELKKLFAELVDHSHGHHEAIEGLSKHIKELEKRVRALENKIS